MENEMTNEEIKEAIIEADWQIHYLSGEIKKFSAKLKAQEFLKTELSKKITPEELK